MHQPSALLRSTTRTPRAGPSLQEGEAPCAALFSSPPCPLSLPCGKRFRFQKRDFPFLPVLFPAKATNRVIQTGDIGSLCEGLNDCSTVCQLQTSSKIARVSGLKKGWCDLSAQAFARPSAPPSLSHHFQNELSP